MRLSKYILATALLLAAQRNDSVSADSTPALPGQVWGSPMENMQASLQLHFSNISKTIVEKMPDGTFKQVVVPADRPDLKPVLVASTLFKNTSTNTVYIIASKTRGNHPSFFTVALQGSGSSPVAIDLHPNSPLQRQIIVPIKAGESHSFIENIPFDQFSSMSTNDKIMAGFAISQANNPGSATSAPPTMVWSNPVLPLWDELKASLHQNN